MILSCKNLNRYSRKIRTHYAVESLFWYPLDLLFLKFFFLQFCNICVSLCMLKYPPFSICNAVCNGNMSLIIQYQSLLLQHECYFGKITSLFVEFRSCLSLNYGVIVLSCCCYTILPIKIQYMLYQFQFFFEVLCLKHLLSQIVLFYDHWQLVVFMQPD